MWNQTKLMSAAPTHSHYFTLWIKQLSCIKTNVITDNYKKIGREYQLFDLTGEQRLERPQLMQNQKVRIKCSVRNDNCLPWYELKDSDATDTQLKQWWHDAAWPTQFWLWCNVWGHRDLWCVFCTPLLAACSTRSSQLDLNLANF